MIFHFYASFKNESRKAEILDLIINHNLHLETGRHATPKTPIHGRICSFCQSDEIEDERHVLFSYTFYDKIRIVLNNKITLKYPLLLDLNSKTLFLFDDVDPFISGLISAFIFQAMNIRHEILYKTKLDSICYFIIVSVCYLIAVNFLFFSQ